MNLLSAIEYSAFCTWVRESNSLWAYPGILFMHTLGTAVAVGMSALVDLRVLGVARRLPVAPLGRYFPVIWAGFWVSALSGTILFAADATSKIVSPLFGLKMLAIVFGVLTMVRIRQTVFRGPSVRTPRSHPERWLAAGSLLLWVVAIAAGRLMAYIAF
ncbi:MAG: hypothetical protein ABI868_11830 [Acidobacteriota bacterium]